MCYISWLGRVEVLWHFLYRFSTNPPLFSLFIITHTHNCVPLTPEPLTFFQGKLVYFLDIPLCKCWGCLPLICLVSSHFSTTSTFQIRIEISCALLFPLPFTLPLRNKFFSFFTCHFSWVWGGRDNRGIWSTCCVQPEGSPNIKEHWHIIFLASDDTFVLKCPSPL